MDHPRPTRRHATRSTTGSPGPRPEQPLHDAATRREFRCAVCGATFVSREQLDDHQRVEHTP